MGGTKKDKDDRGKTSKTDVESKKKDAELPELKGSKPHIRFLHDFNKRMEDREVLSDQEMKLLWHDYLWASAPDALLMEECGGLNAMHLRGLLLARAVGFTEMENVGNGVEDFAVPDLVPETEDVHVHDKPINQLTAHELRDSVEACQIHMRRLLDLDGVDACQNVIFRLFVRFGMLANAAYDEEVLDDHAYMTRIPTSEIADGVLHIYTCKALRTMVNIFVVLFRAIDITRRAVPMRVCEEDNSTHITQGVEKDSVPEKYVKTVHEMIKSFHVEATLDEFNILQQMFYLKPAQRLVYRHNFAGMFNDISQVTYFHYPAYCRSSQVSETEMRNKQMNALPCLGSIIPQLGIMYDDDAGLPFGSTPNSEWTWIVSVGVVYLWDARNRRILKSGGVY